MNAATLAAVPGLEQATRAGSCYHCGELLGDSPVHQQVEQASRDFCCSGCAAAAQWIHSASLDDYYALRSQPAGRAAPDASDLAVWDRMDVMSAYQRAVPGGCEVVLLTDGMRCAACAWLIDRALAREPGVREVVANAVTGRIRLVWNPAANRLSQILRRLIALGYRPFLAGGREEEAARRADTRRWMLRVGLAGIATLQAMMLAEALYLDPQHQMPASTRDFFRWLTFLISTPVIFYAGFPFLAGAWRELTQRRAGLDVLVSSATLLAWGASTFETVRGGPHVWFDTAVMFIFLLLAARMIEQRARRVAVARIDALARATPVLADRERADGSIEAVPVAQLARGEVVRVAAGANVPADAELLGHPRQLRRIAAHRRIPPDGARARRCRAGRIRPRRSHRAHPRHGQWRRHAPVGAHAAGAARAGASAARGAHGRPHRELLRGRPGAGCRRRLHRMARA